ncbi:MAG TPA: hypothetical protein VGB45_15605 [Abditibacterium sp.]|jgi:hypothetical protein
MREEAPEIEAKSDESSDVGMEQRRDAKTTHALGQRFGGILSRAISIVMNKSRKALSFSKTKSCEFLSGL